jgi:MFS family permease
MKNSISLFIISFLATAIGGTVSTLMSVYLPVVLHELVGINNNEELDRIGGYINAVFIIGWTAGGFLFGLISDHIGRKLSLIYATACFGLATLLTGMMSGWEGVIICRIFSGFGVGGIMVVSNTYMTEVWPEKTRAIYIGILSISFPIGIFSAGLINNMVSSWRQGFYIGFVPLLIAITGFVVLKESDSWKNRNKVLRSINEIKLFDKQNSHALLLGSITFGTMLIGLWGIFSWLPTWVQSLITHGDGQQERGISMMLLGMGGLTGGFISGWLANAIGLRKSMIICFGACAVLSIILFKTNNIFNPVTIYSELALLSLFFGASQGILSVFVPLLFPVAVRASATGFCFNIGRIFTALAVLFVGVLVTRLGGYGNSLLVFSLIFIIGLISLFLNKEKPRVS